MLNASLEQQSRHVHNFQMENYCNLSRNPKLMPIRTSTSWKLALSLIQHGRERSALIETPFTQLPTILPRTIDSISSMKEEEEEEKKNLMSWTQHNTSTTNKHPCWGWQKSFQLNTSWWKFPHRLPLEEEVTSIIISASHHPRIMPGLPPRRPLNHVSSRE